MTEYNDPRYAELFDAYDTLPRSTLAQYLARAKLATEALEADLSRERHDHAATIEALDEARHERDEAAAMRRLAEHERDCLRRALARERRRVAQLRRAVLAWASLYARLWHTETDTHRQMMARARDRSRDDV